MSNEKEIIKIYGDLTCYIPAGTYSRAQLRDLLNDMHEHKTALDRAARKSLEKLNGNTNIDS